MDLHFFLIVIGLLLEVYGVGKEFLGFSSIGNWLIYIGFVMFLVITLQAISKKNRIVDERMQWMAMKASRITFVAIIFSAFIIMIVDGIRPITVPYSYFMSYLICGIVFVHFITYKILEKFN